MNQEYQQTYKIIADIIKEDNEILPNRISDLSDVLSKIKTPLEYIKVISYYLGNNSENLPNWAIWASRYKNLHDYHLKFINLPVDSCNNTLLHYIMTDKHTFHIMLLLKLGGSLFIKNNDGITPLDKYLSIASHSNDSILLILHEMAKRRYDYGKLHYVIVMVLHSYLIKRVTISKERFLFIDLESMIVDVDKFVNSHEQNLWSSLFSKININRHRVLQMYLGLFELRKKMIVIHACLEYALEDTCIELIPDILEYVVDYICVLNEYLYGRHLCHPKGWSHDNEGIPYVINAEGKVETCIMFSSKRQKTIYDSQEKES